MENGNEMHFNNRQPDQKKKNFDKWVDIYVIKLQSLATMYFLVSFLLLAVVYGLWATWCEFGDSQVRERGTLVLERYP